MFCANILLTALQSLLFDFVFKHWRIHTTGADATCAHDPLPKMQASNESERKHTRTQSNKQCFRNS